MTKNRRASRLDEWDREILALLRDSGRTPIADMRPKVERSAASIHGRLKRLEDRATGCIRGYHADLDYARLGLGFAAYVGVKLQQAEASRPDIEKAIRRIPEVESMARTAGDFDALLLVRTRDTEHLQDVVFRIQASAKGVYTHTMVVLSVPFDNHGVRFEEIPERGGEAGRINQTAQPGAP